MRFLVILIFLTVLGASVEARAEAHDRTCGVFRAGKIINDRIVDFDLSNQEESQSDVIDLWFDPRYVFRPPAPPRPDGSPKRAVLFELNSVGGKPVDRQERWRTLPTQERRRILPTNDTYVTILVSGRDSTVSLDRMIRIAAYAPSNAAYTITDSMLGPYHLLDIPEGRWTAKDYVSRREVFAKFKGPGELTEVMSCRAEGTVLNPSCTIDFKNDVFHVKVSSIRRNEEQKFREIRELVDRFVECLTIKDTSDDY